VGANLHLDLPSPPGSRGIAVGIAIASLGAEIYAFQCVGRHLGFSTSVSSQFSRTVKIRVGMADPKNIGVAVEIALLSSVETEIMILPYPLPL